MRLSSVLAICEHDAKVLDGPRDWENGAPRASKFGAYFAVELDDPVDVGAAPGRLSQCVDQLRSHVFAGVTRQ